MYLITYNCIILIKGVVNRISYNWASEATPTLGCSIETSRDIYSYIYIFDCLWENNTKKLYAKLRRWNYVVQTRACSIISFESLKRSADYNFCLEFLIYLHQAG